MSLDCLTHLVTNSPAYSNSLHIPSLADAVTSSTTTAKRKGHSKDPWCIPTLTSNSSDNSESTLTLVFAPSYSLITDLTKTSGILFFLVAHSYTLLHALSRTFSRSTKHTYNFFPLAAYSSCSLLKISTGSIIPPSGMRPICTSSTVTNITQTFLDGS